jgi:hypothetical protein
MHNRTAGGSHRQAARGVEQEIVAEQHMVATDWHPRNQLGPRVELGRTHQHDRMIQFTKFGYSKRIVINAQS